MDDFFKENDLKWSNCVGVCTDGAAAMTGRHVGFISKVKSVANAHITFTHCMIHREALVAKKVSLDLNSVLQDAVRIINFIKSRALNTRLFVNFCKDMGSEYEKLLLHSEIRWLSRGRTLRRLMELKHEVMLFLAQKNSADSELFHNEQWMCKLSYLSDIFEKLNELNLSLQGTYTNIFNLGNKIQAFVKKINVWKSLVTNDRFEMFSYTNDFVTENNLDCNFIKTVIIDHLESLEKQFKKYFQPDINSHFDWVQKPFNESIQNITHLPLKAQEEFAELSSDTNLKLEFAQTNLNSFWINVKDEFPILSDLAIKMLLPFATTYLCESAFSTLVVIKSKNRSCLTNVETAMRPALSEIIPRLDLLCKLMQAHPSH